MLAIRATNVQVGHLLHVFEKHVLATLKHSHVKTEIIFVIKHLLYFNDKNDRFLT